MNDRNTTDNRLPNVDITNLLRDLAALFVFVLHGKSYVDGINDVSVLRYATTLPAWAGVWVFVYLSGYTIGLGFFSGRYKVQNPDGKLTWKGYWRFVVGRFWKIAPLYYAYLVLFELFNGNTYLFANPVLLLKTLTFTFNGVGGFAGMGHLWYISMAMQMYVLMPFVYLLIRRMKSRKSLLLGFVTVLLIGFVIRFVLSWMNADWYTWIYTFTPCNMDLVFCGMIVAAYKAQYAEAKAGSFAVRAVASMLLAALVVYNIYIYSSETDLHLTIYRIYLPTLYVLVCAVNTLAMSDLRYKPMNVARIGVLRKLHDVIDWFSRNSYAFYVFHIAVFEYVKNCMKNTGAYVSGTVYMRALVFYGSSIIITISVAVVANRMMNGFKRVLTK